VLRLPSRPSTVSTVFFVSLRTSFFWVLQHVELVSHRPIQPFGLFDVHSVSVWTTVAQSHALGRSNSPWAIERLSWCKSYAQRTVSHTPRGSVDIHNIQLRWILKLRLAITSPVLRCRYVAKQERSDDALLRPGHVRAYKQFVSPMDLRSPRLARMLSGCKPKLYLQSSGPLRSDLQSTSESRCCTGTHFATPQRHISLRSCMA
jgi:hypothetical protein